MKVRISERLRAISPSLTLAVSQRAARLRAQGVDVIGFGAGEPDFDTPDHIKQAARAALDAGATKYTHVAGTAELRAAVAEELSRVHGVPVAVENVVVSVGAKHSLYNLFMTLLDPGDEVVIPSPCWVSYPELVQMAGGTPVILETRAEEGYRIDERRLAEVVGLRTRAIVLCSPSNPTGATYDRRTLEGVARVVAERGGPDTFVITDDIYRRLVYTGEWTSIAHVARELAPRIIHVDGVSKSYAMTGWRIGYCAAPREVAAAMTTLQSQSTTNAAAVSQAAALAALTGPQDCVEVMRREFDRRRRAMVAGLRAIPGVTVHDPEGAFYAFPDLRAYLGKHAPDDVTLAELLLDRARVAIVPGSGFLAPGFARLSYAASMAEIEEGLRRIARALGGVGRLTMAFGFVVDDECPEKLAAGGAGEFAARLAESPGDGRDTVPSSQDPGASRGSAHQATCPACRALDEPFACVGLLPTPLGADAERWLVEHLPEDIESLPGFLLRKAIGDYGYDGSFARELRAGGRLEAPGPFTRHFGPFFRRFTVSSEQLLEELLGAGDVQPPHGLACLAHLGAVAVDGRVLLSLDDGVKLADLIADPASRRDRTRCTIEPSDQDPEDVASLKRYLRALWAAFAVDAPVRIFVGE